MYEPKDILQATADISADWSVQATESRDRQSSKDVTSAGTDDDRPQPAHEEPATVSAEIGIVETSGNWSPVGSHSVTASMSSSQRDRSKKLSRHSPPPTYFPPSSDNQYRRDFLSELMSSSDDEESFDATKGRSRAWNNASKSIDLQPSDLISSSDGASMASSAAKSSSKAKPASSWTKSPPSQAKPPAKSPRVSPSHVTDINIKKVERGRANPEDSGTSDRTSDKARGGSAPSQLGATQETASSWKVEDRRPMRSKDREQNSSIKLVEEALSAVRRLDRTSTSRSSPPAQREASPGEFSIDEEIRQILEIDADIDAMLSTGFSPVKARKSPPSGRPRRTQRQAFPAESEASLEQYDARPHPASARGAGVIATRQSSSPPRQRMEYANSMEDEYAADEPTEIRALMLQGTYPQYRPARNPQVGKGLPVYRVSGRYNVPTSLRPPVMPVASRECFDTYSAWWDTKVPVRGPSKGAQAAPKLWDEEPHLLTNSLAASPSAKDFGHLSNKFQRSKWRSKATPDKNERFDEYSPYVEKTGLENLPLEYRKQVAKKQEAKSGVRKSYIDDLLKTGTAAGFKSKANTWSSVQDFFHGEHAPAPKAAPGPSLDVHPYF